MHTTSDIVSLADAYCTATGLPTSTISARIFNDAKIIERLRNGSGITLARFNHALTWFAVNWPLDLSWPPNIAWPSGVERPRRRRTARA